MDRTFFVRALGNGRILVRNNDNGETKILADTDMLREYIDDYLETFKDKKDDGKEPIKNGNIKQVAKRKVF